MSSLKHEIYQALGDPARLTMVERLGEHGPMTTMHLVEGLGMTRQAATKHLVVLENVGLVSSTVNGRQIMRGQSGRYPDRIDRYQNAHGRHHQRFRHHLVSVIL